MAKIGIMGGTFDPVHNGHLLLARQACDEYGLDRVWFMPSGQPPHKKDKHITSAKHRCAMVRLAIRGEAAFEFSDFEVLREGNTYTAETIRLLKQTFPEHGFYYLIGADSLYEIESWYHAEEVLASIPFLAAARAYDKEHRMLEEQAAYLEGRYGARIQILHCPQTDISSEEIRRALREGCPVRGEVPEAVGRYIDLHRLYR